jgi:hypothetical protein
MATLNVFLYGVLTGLAFVAGVFFVRYWRTSNDRFFMFLAVTFRSLAANWASLVWNPSEEHAAYIYLPRLFAFGTLLVGIADKNRRASRT